MFGPPVQTSFVGQMKEISSSVEEASTVSNDSGSGKNNPQHWSRLWETSIGKDVHTFQKPFVSHGK